MIFTGFVSREDKMAAFTDADVFVTPKLTGFPSRSSRHASGTPIMTTGNGDLLGWVDNTVGFNTAYTPERLPAPWAPAR